MPGVRFTPDPHFFFFDLHLHNSSIRFIFVQANQNNMSVSIHHFYRDNTPHAAHLTRCELFNAIATLGECERENVCIKSHSTGPTQIFKIMEKSGLEFCVMRSRSTQHGSVHGFIYTFQTLNENGMPFNENTALFLFQSFASWCGAIIAPDEKHINACTKSNSSKIRLIQHSAH